MNRSVHSPTDGIRPIFMVFISPSKMYEIIFTLVLKDFLRTGSCFKLVRILPSYNLLSESLKVYLSRRFWSNACYVRKPVLHKNNKRNVWNWIFSSKTDFRLMISLLFVLQININLSDLFFESTKTPFGQDLVKNVLIISGFRGSTQISNLMLSRGTWIRTVWTTKFWARMGRSSNSDNSLTRTALRYPSLRRKALKKVLNFRKVKFKMIRLMNCISLYAL